MERVLDGEKLLQKSCVEPPGVSEGQQEAHAAGVGVGRGRGTSCRASEATARLSPLL